ncbi:hypothetical protein CROQUDRAFT_655490 [Cronartium quercuum f. sp. fusiforme G11]|uniref:VWFA domain-containing protein n=1 Tax=Cronartium quercuum f. sp. fusiforme G11 TaxID=708437 RepID=A0A9P6TDP3_9BASI|nr:hypothetical protein CROQUDRAFT_655490 [Cronartium quercuum f. sp. fusiforme G11]
MPLEATVCMLDNSDYSINSDVTPTRLEAASDAVKTIFRAKTNANPESTCGLMTFSGKSPTVLVTPTTDEGKIHVSLQSVKPHGLPDILSGLSVASLALKHRQEKNQKQRAIVLLSTPLPSTITIEDLTKLGKKLKKNNVAVDVILFGSEIEDNEERLKAFVDSVNSDGNSKFLSIPSNLPGLLSDHIKQSDILSEEGFGSGSRSGLNDVGVGSSGNGGDEGGLDLDPNLDPELAMALRMSLQEEEARQAAAARQDSSTSSTTPKTTTQVPSTATEETSAMLSEDDELAQALALSRGDDIEMNDVDDQQQPAQDEELSEEEAIAKAIEMSMSGKKS